MVRLLRLVTVCALCGGLVMLVAWRVGMDQQQRVIDDLRELNEDMQQRLDARQAMIDRMSRSRRVAHLQVLEQRPTGGPEGGVETRLLFIELDEEGGELDRRQFTLPGDVVFVDAWTVKFPPEQVAHGHPLHGRTLVLLRRIYTDRMPPREGLPLDTPGGVPPAYGVSELARFEQSLWAHFWRIATEPGVAESMGVRVAQGEAVYKQMRPEQVYELVVDAAGGLNLTPIPPETSVMGRASAG